MAKEPTIGEKEVEKNIYGYVKANYLKDMKEFNTEELTLYMTIFSAVQDIEMRCEQIIIMSESAVNRNRYVLSGQSRKMLESAVTLGYSLDRLEELYKKNHNNNICTSISNLKSQLISVCKVANDIQYKIMMHESALSDNK